MKIALIYTGLAKTNNKILNNHIQYIINEYFNIDTYIHTYNTDKHTLELLENTLKPKYIYIDNIIEVEKKIQFYISYISKTTDTTKPTNVLSMFYKWQQSLKFLENKNYDIVIRNRLDLMFTKPLLLTINNCINIPSGGDHWGGLMDLFAYSNQENMKYYKNLYLYIEKYLLHDKALFHPETLLRHHITKNNISINRFNYPIILRDQIFTNTAPTYL